MTLPTITKQQTYILFLLYKFRFLTTFHIQKLLNHHNPQYSQLLLKDLKDKKYIATTEKENKQKTLIDNNQPFIYHLSARARHVLKENEDVDSNVLERIYKEHTRTERFIQESLAVADMYLFFLLKKKKNENLHFSTKIELASYEYFPEHLPSAYIAVKTNKGTRRYFLHYFDQQVPSGVIRGHVVMYLKYADSGNWQAQAGEEPLPSILFVFAKEKTKKHIYMYSKALLEKAYEEKISLFLTTKKVIDTGKDTNIWEKVTPQY